MVHQEEELSLDDEENVIQENESPEMHLNVVAVTVEQIYLRIL